MTNLISYFADCPVIARHRPWPRVELTRERWAALAGDLARESWEVVSLWAEPDLVNVALREPESGTYLVATRPCPDGAFESLTAARPGAARLERHAREMTGLAVTGLEDERAWHDHGRWALRHPLGAAAEPRGLGEPPAKATDYRFLPVEGEGVHQIAVGPVHAGIIEPGHFRFHANGETVVRLEARLGYVHRGIERLMEAKSPGEASRIAQRISGDSAVGHALAFARAVEAATDAEAPPRARWLRGLMAEIERVANHLGDFGAVCNDASFAFIHAETATLREDTLRLCGKLFGHRLMMDQVIPGGVARDLDEFGLKAIAAWSAALAPRFERLVAIYDSKPSLLDRTIATGAIGRHLAQRFAAGGVIGRAAGRGLDARAMPGYAPYDELEFTVPVLDSGDVHARLLVRAEEVRASLSLIAQIAAGLPAGAIAAAYPARAGEGLAVVEGFRGDIVTAVKLDEAGRIARCFPRDPSWLQWPLLEAAIEGNIVADFPLCNKSFNCSYAGHDL